MPATVWSCQRCSSPDTSLVSAVCCSFCLWKDVPKAAAHGECAVWIHCKRGCVRKYKAKLLWAQTLLCVAPRPLWHLYMITKNHGGAVEKTAFGLLVSSSGKCPRYLSFVLQLVLDAKRWEVLWKKEKILLLFPSVFIIVKQLASFCSIFLSHSPQQVHHLRMSHHPSLGHHQMFS